MKKLLLLVCTAMFVACPGFAKKKKVVPPKPAPKREVRKPATKGLFNVQRHKDDWYLQVPDSMLGRPFLANTRFVSTPVDAEVYGGELANSQVLYWELHDKQLQLRSMIYRVEVNEENSIAQAVRAANEDPIVASIRLDSVESRRDTTDARKPMIYSVKVNDLFKGDNPVLSISSSRKESMGLTGLKPELSYIDTIMTFPINTEIVTVKTYNAKNTSRMTSARETGLATIRLRTSFVLLPKEPMRYRQFDPRVGYFASSFRKYSDEQQHVENRTVAARWRLEPKEEDMEKYRRGELVEPKKQIVYYIDPATPQQWRKYLIQGVEDWNEAFKEAGWKNAIVAKEWPNDSTMSLEDARYSVIRYLASPISNAYGPHVSDPRSGEILETHIGWYHNVMQLVHDWYMVQAGAVDKRAQSLKFDDELMGQLIRFVSSHEVGHTLGLRHNMGASFATPVEKLRDKKWVEEHGHTASIMDYARFNYVAQPEDNISERGIFPRINDYDKWAIKWGYTYFPDAKTEKEERLALNKKTIEAQKNPRLWFGGEGYDNDPRAQTEDLGDDAMKASDYGIRNLKRIIKQLPQWVHEEADMGNNLSTAYNSLIGQMRRYVGHVSNNIGGVYHNYKSVEEEGSVYRVEEKERQRRALMWLDKNVLVEPHWLIAEPYITRLTQNPERMIQPFADQAISALCSSGTFRNLAANSFDKKSYQPEDYITDLINVLFRETATGEKLSSWRRYVQRNAVQRLLKDEANVLNDDAHPFMISTIRRIQSRINAAKASDSVTRAHYQDLAQQIKMHFEK